MLLGSTKAELDRLLGKPVMARNVLGLPGEKSWSYAQGDFEIVVGFLNDIARYTAVKRRRGPNTQLSPAELAGVLSLNAPASLWTVETPETPKKPSAPARRKTATEPRVPTYFSHVEKDPKVKEKVIREVRGWMPGGKPYAFFYLPALDGQPPLLVSEWGVDQALG